MKDAAPHKFSRDERLKLRLDFRDCIREGGRAAGKYVMVYVEGNGLAVTRIGAGSTKRLGNAVERNRQKRLVREAFRLTKHELPAGVDMVVLPRIPWCSPTLDELKADLLDAAHRAAAKLKTEA